MTVETTYNKVKEIKRSFRLLMNGVASSSMRGKGLEYKINWGVQLQALEKIAAVYGKDYELAIELWKEDIRECKILATLIMPADSMLQDVAEIWMEQTKSQEIAELAAFNLYCRLDYAPVLAFRWIASDNAIRQLCGFQILANLFRDGEVPDERGMNEYLDQVQTALSGNALNVRHAALNSLFRFSELGEEYKNIAHAALPDFV